MAATPHDVYTYTVLKELRERIEALESKVREQQEQIKEIDKAARPGRYWQGGPC